MYAEENPDLSVDPSSSPLNPLITAEKDEEFPEQAELLNQEAAHESQDNISSP